MDPHHAGPAIFKEVAEPSTPDAGFVLVYAGTDGALHTKDDAGTIADLGGGEGGLTHFTEGRADTGINASTPVVSLSATGAEENIDVAIVTKGTGALLTQVPDGTAAGGNKRGARAINLCLNRSNALNVAAGTDSIAIGLNARAQNASDIAIRGYAAGGTSTAIGGSATGQRAYAFGGSSLGLDTVSIGSLGYAGNTQSVGLMGTAKHPFEIGFPVYPISTFNNVFHQGILTGIVAATTNSTPTIFTVRTQAGPDNFVIPSNSNYALFLRVFAVNGGGQISKFTREFQIKNIKGTTSINGPVVTVGTDITEILGSAISIEVNDSNDTLQMKVTGEAEYNITGSEATNIITAIGHPFQENDIVYINTITGGSGLTANPGALWFYPRYFVRNVSGDTFSLSTAEGGSIVDFTTDITDGTISRHVRWMGRLDIMEIADFRTH